MRAATLICGALLIGLSSEGFAQEISETLGKPLRAALLSPKQPIDLEFCVADAITRVGGAIPVMLHDGPERTLLLGYGHTPKIVVVLGRISSGTELKIFTKSGDVDERFVEYVKTSCKLS